MISMIEKETGCHLFIGQNGRIWITGPPQQIPLVAGLIKQIEREAHTSGLTNRILGIIQERDRSKSHPQEIDD